MSNSKVFAIISFVCGLLALVTGCFGGGFLLAIAAIVLGIISRKKDESKKGLAITGIITGAIGFVTSCIALIIYIVQIAGSTSNYLF